LKVVIELQIVTIVICTPKPGQSPGDLAERTLVW